MRFGRYWFAGLFCVHILLFPLAAYAGHSLDEALKELSGGSESVSVTQQTPSNPVENFDAGLALISVGAFLSAAGLHYLYYKRDRLIEEQAQLTKELNSETSVRSLRAQPYKDIFSDMVIKRVQERVTNGQPDEEKAVQKAYEEISKKL